MFRLSKKVEYGILSMQYLADRENTLVSAKEISENLNISFEFLAKTLQSLMKKGLVVSTKGIKGGYLLAKPSSEINLEEIIVALDSKIALTECFDDNIADCERMESCSIKQPLEYIQLKIDELFRNTKLSELKSDIAKNLVQIELMKN